MSDLLKAEEVAARLRISRAQVYVMANDGRLPHVRFGERAIRFPAGEVEKWLAAQFREPFAARDSSSDVSGR